MAALAKPFTDEQKSNMLKNLQHDLPPGWAVHFSKNHVNRVFYFNKKDGTRTWEHPALKSGSLNLKTHNSRKRKSGERKDKIPAPDIKTNSQAIKSEKAVTQQKSKFNPISSSKTFHAKKASLPTGNGSKSRGKGDNSRKKTKSKFSAEKTVTNSLSVPENKMTDLKTGIETKQTKPDTITTTSNAALPKEEATAPVITEDVEMIEIDITPAKKQCLDHAEKNKIPEEADSARFYFCIIDTNVLLLQHALNAIDTAIKDQDGQSTGRNFTFIVPWVVLQELDHLKKSKQEARSAISFLNENFKANHAVIRGQSIFEASAIIDGFTIENNDDRILQCCFTAVQESPDGSVPILISRDKNLANKSLANGIKCFEDITEVQKFFGRGALKINSKNSAMPLKTPERAKPSTHQKLNTNRNTTVQRSWKEHELSAMYFKSREIILPTLSFILEKEMKDAFSELWLDIVLFKPPWTMIDVLKCIQKHWLAVFKVLGVDRIVEVHTTNMLSMEKKTQPSNFEFVKIWVFSAVCLIAGINQRLKYNEPVKSNLAELQKIHKSLSIPRLQEGTKLDSSEVMKDVEESSSLMSPQNCSTVEMKEEDVKTDDFWVALNKIWTSIISHCCMIFQSLSFVPSKISNCPEVCQALTVDYASKPSRPIATQALPFVKDLVVSLQAPLEKFSSLASTDEGFGPVFLDLLQTLWTAIQAFCVECDIHSLIPSHQDICIVILSSEDMVQRLKTGLHQLGSVNEMLEECLVAALA